MEHRSAPLGPLASAEYYLVLSTDLEALDDAPVLRGTHSDKIWVHWQDDKTLCIVYFDLTIREFQNSWWYTDQAQELARPEHVELVLVRSATHEEWKERVTTLAGASGENGESRGC